TTGNRLFFVVQALLTAVTTGTAALVARAWGAGDRNEAALATRASLWLVLTFAAAMTVPGVLFARQIANLFPLEPETRDLATVFIRWLSVFHLAFGANFVLSVALRAAGDTRTPLYVGAGANVLNVFLAYGLVRGAFGFPRLGIAGAAIANGLSFTA